MKIVTITLLACVFMAKIGHALMAVDSTGISASNEAAVQHKISSLQCNSGDNDCADTLSAGHNIRRTHRGSAKKK